jgi:hypothetical protein
MKAIADNSQLDVGDVVAQCEQVAAARVDLQARPAESPRPQARGENPLAGGCERHQLLGRVDLCRADVRASLDHAVVLI